MLTVAAVLVGLACLVWPARDRGPAGAGGRCGPSTGLLGAQVAGGADAVVGEGQGTGAGWPVVQRWRGSVAGRRTRGSPWVADFAEVVAVGLEAGLDLGSAALASARSPGVVDRAPWLHRRLSASVGVGHGVSGCLEPPAGARAADARDLALLAAAWRLAEEVGAGACAVTSAAADAVRGRRAAGERAAVVAAGPRASMWLLTMLPLAGPLAGALVGVGPERLYGSGAGRAAAVAGLALTGVGWWWSRTILARARRPGRTAGGPG